MKFLRTRDTLNYIGCLDYKMLVKVVQADMGMPQRLTRFDNIQAELYIVVRYSPDPHESE